MSQIIHQHKQKKLVPSPHQNKYLKMLLPRWHHFSSLPGLKEGLGRELYYTLHFSLALWVQKVNSDFLFTLKDLRPLRFPVASWRVCALVSELSAQSKQMGSLTVSLHPAFHKKIRILQSLIVSRFYEVLSPSPDFSICLDFSLPRDVSFERMKTHGTSKCDPRQQGQTDHST